MRSALIFLLICSCSGQSQKTSSPDGGLDAGPGPGDAASAATPASPEAVRAAYGLEPGSCWRYTSMTQPEATVSVSGPDTNAVPGRTIYKQSYQPANGGLPNEYYFDTDTTPGEIRLARSIEHASDGSTTSSRYDSNATPPLFARFSLDSGGNAVMAPGSRFVTTSTPAGGAPEHYEWDVLAYGDSVMTTSGMKPAYVLRYMRDSQTATYYLAPGFGVAKFQDLEVCSARVCDASGACVGAPNCDVCPPH